MLVFFQLHVETIILVLVQNTPCTVHFTKEFYIGFGEFDVPNKSLMSLAII